MGRIISAIQAIAFVSRRHRPHVLEEFRDPAEKLRLMGQRQRKPKRYKLWVEQWSEENEKWELFKEPLFLDPPLPDRVPARISTWLYTVFGNYRGEGLYNSKSRSNIIEFLGILDTQPKGPMGKLFDI